MSHCWKNLLKRWSSSRHAWLHKLHHQCRYRHGALKEIAMAHSRISPWRTQGYRHGVLKDIAMAHSRISPWRTQGYRRGTLKDIAVAHSRISPWRTQGYRRGALKDIAVVHSRISPWWTQGYRHDALKDIAMAHSKYLSLLLLFYKNLYSEVVYMCPLHVKHPSEGSQPHKLIQWCIFVGY